MLKRPLIVVISVRDPPVTKIIDILLVCLMLRRRQVALTVMRTPILTVKLLTALIVIFLRFHLVNDVTVPIHIFLLHLTRVAAATLYDLELLCDVHRFQVF